MVNTDYLYDHTFFEKHFSKYHYDKTSKLSYKEYYNSYIVNSYMENGHYVGGVYTESLDFVDGTAIRRGIGEVNDKSRIVTGSTEDDTVIYIGMLVNVWGHHLTDNIKRLWFLDSDEYKSKYSGCKLVYVSAEGQTSYKDMPLNMRKLLSILGIDENNITPITDITRFKKIIVPDDYGVIALMMVFITIANVFVINGFGNALIQKKNADNRDFSSVFYFNIIFSIAVYFILFAFAPAIARFYHMPVICPALRVLSLRIVIASVNSVQQAYVSRNMLFKRFFWSTLFGTLLSGVVGIVMAYKGCGVWAIVAQYLTNTCVDTIVLWITVKWRPEKYFSFRNLGELISYGWKILVSGLLDTGYNQLRNLVIGKKYSSADLAQYNKGQQYPQLIVTNVISSISGVLFPAISKCQDDLNNVKNITRRAIKVSSYVMWPLMIGLAVIARPLVIVMLTEKWLPCVPFVWIACFTFGLYPIHSSNQEAIKALGRSDLFLRLEIIKKTIGVTILIISMRYGVMAIALSQIVTSILSTFINASPNRKLLGYSYIEQIKDMIPSFALAVAMGIVIYPLAFIIKNNILLIIAQVIAGIFIYIGLTKVFKNDNLSYLLKFVKRKRQ